MAMTRPLSEQVRFTQKGAGAVERLASEKLKEWVSVKDFGAVGDGVTDDTAAIQAALDGLGIANNIKLTVYFPPGIYVTSSPIILRNSSVSVIGAGPISTQIWCTGSNSDGIRIRRDDWADSGVIQGVSLSNFGLHKKGGTVTGACYGIREQLSSGTSINNVGIYDFTYGLSKEGCVNSFTSQLKVFQGLYVTNTVTDSFGIKLTSITLANSSVYVGFTHKFNQIFLADHRAAASMQYGVLLEHTDVALFSDLYVGRCASACVYTRKRAGVAAGYVAAVHFQNSYFDGVALAENRKGIKMYAEAGLKLNTFRFDNCIFGQFETAFESTVTDLTGLHIDGTFIYNTKHSVYIEGAKQVSVNVNGNNLNTSGAAAAVLIFNSIANLSVSCDFVAVSGPAAVRLAGAHGAVNIKNITVDSAFAGAKLDFSASVSRAVNLPPIGFTPAMLIGGSETGIAYSNRQGTFSVTNGMCSVTASFSLTSKGVGSGNVFLKLPESVQPVGIGSGSLVSVLVTNAGTAINNAVVTGLTYGGSTATVYKGNGTGILALNDADMTDISIVYYTAQYPVK